MSDHRLPACAAADLQAARSAWATQLLSVRWGDALSWQWMGRCCRRLAELEQRIAVSWARGNTSEALALAAELADLYRASARRGACGGSPFAPGVLLKSVRHEASDTTIRVFGMPPDDGPESGRAA